MKFRKNLVLVLGVTTCLIGAVLMAFGEPIIGAEHTGIATVVLIGGIGLLGKSNTSPIKTKKKEKMINE